MQFEGNAYFCHFQVPTFKQCNQLLLKYSPTDNGKRCMKNIATLMKNPHSSRFEL